MTGDSGTALGNTDHSLLVVDDDRPFLTRLARAMRAAFRNRYRRIGLRGDRQA